MDMKIYQHFFAAIVKQAVVDWHTLIKNNAPQKKFDKYRDFFRSAWGKYVCGYLGLSAENLLNGLEAIKMKRG